MNTNLENQSAGRETAHPGWLRTVEAHVGSLRFGVVQIVVHDGHVVQIERTERLRLDRQDWERTSANKPKSPQSSGG